MRRTRKDKGAIHQRHVSQSPILDEYHLDIKGPFRGGLWWYCVELEYDGVIYERQGVASTRGACFDAVWAYRAEVVAG